MDDGHQLASQILDRMEGKPPPIDDAPEGVGEADMGLDAACEDAMAAFKSGDVSGLKAAMRSMFAQLAAESSD